MSTLNVLPLVLTFADNMPDEKDVTAGWMAFAVFVLLIVAVGFLGWSLTKQLRKAQAAEDAGLYGHDDVAPVDATGATSATEDDGTDDRA